MQEKAAADNALWGKIAAIITEGGLIGSLIGLSIRQPDESLEIILVMTFGGLGFGWCVAEYVRIRSGHRW